MSATDPSVVVRLDAYEDTIVVSAHRDAFSTEPALFTTGRPVLQTPPAHLGTHLLDYPATITVPPAWAQTMGPGNLETTVRAVGDAALERFDA